MSKNLVNGDSLKKYHIGVNTPNISEELINENVTSFKVGTSNVNGVDLTNQMEQSLVTLDNINGNSFYESYNLETVTITDDSNTIELFGLPNGVCDKYINGIVYRNIGSINLSNIKKSDITRVTSWDNTNTLMFLIKVPDIKLVTSGSDVSCISTHYMCVSDYEIVTNDVVSFAVRLKAKEIMFRVSKGLDNVDRLYEYLTRDEKNIIVYYEKEIPSEEHVQISYLCKPNDIIDTKSPIPFTCSHTIQLNTKSQVEEAQRRITNNNKNIWQKFKELTDVEMKLEENGYIKLPTVLGGLILQWGKLDVKFENTWNKVGTFTPPIKLTNLYFANSSVISCNNGDPIYGTSTFVMNNGSDLSELKYSIIDSRKTNQTLTYSMNWFVIGR